MAFWTHVIDIGHTELMFPLAAAIAAWLFAGRAWKLALCWCMMFAAGAGLVACSKILFLGWGAEIPSLKFKALSGHALCAAAVIPVFFFVVLQYAGAAWRVAGAGGGVAASVGIGALMVTFNYHSAAEVIGGLVLGLMIGIGYRRLSSTFPLPEVSRWTVLASALTFVLIFNLKPAMINHQLVDVALHLSGRDLPFKWPQQLVRKAWMPMSGIHPDMRRSCHRVSG